jgi:hypothetical protein
MKKEKIDYIYVFSILNQQASTEMVKLLQIMIIIMGTIASIFIGKKEDY